MKTKKIFKLFVRDLVMLERSGRYGQALSRLTDIWEDYSRLPDVSGLDSDFAAEILLRCGALIGFYGQIEQITNSQESSKNLLTDARNRFIDRNNFEKVAECENYLSLAYYRTNERREAEIWINESLARDIDSLTQARIHSFIIYGSILSGRREYENVIEMLNSVEHLFLSFGDAYFSGVFNSNLGLAYKNFGNIPEAIERLEASKRFHRKSANLISACIVKNNLAQIYRLEGRFSEAHQSVSDAIYGYDQIGDKHRKGSSLDTKAQIYFDEGKYDEALRTADEAIAILEEGVNMSFLTEAYLTKAKSLTYLDEIAAATVIIHEAMGIALKQVGEEGVAELARAFENTIRRKNHSEVDGNEEAEKIFDGEFELVLPPSLANLNKYEVIRIRNSHLVEKGITAGSLALVAVEEVRRGDLVALREIADDSVICGYYDHFAGMVSISSIESETLLFKTEQVQIIGKIVGIGRKDANSDGQIYVDPIEK